MNDAYSVDEGEKLPVRETALLVQHSKYTQQPQTCVKFVLIRRQRNRALCSSDKCAFETSFRLKKIDKWGAYEDTSNIRLLRRMTEYPRRFILCRWKGVCLVPEKVGDGPLVESVPKQSRLSCIRSRSAPMKDR